MKIPAVFRENQGPSKTRIKLLIDLFPLFADLCSMATKKKSKAAKKTAKKAKKKTAKKSSKKTAKKAAKKTAKKSTKTQKKSSSKSSGSSSSSFAAPARSSEPDGEFVSLSSSPSPSYSSPSPAYSSPGISEEENQGSLGRVALLAVLGVVIAVFIVMTLTGGDSDSVADGSDVEKSAVQEPAPEPEKAAEEAAEPEPEAEKVAEPEATPEPTPEAGERSYTVKSGDTLWGVAQSQLGDGGRWKEIMQANNLQSRELSAGQVLKLPK